MKKFVLLLMVASLVFAGAALAAEKSGGSNGKLEKEIEDITKVTYVGPGSINVFKPGDIQMSFGATVRIIPVAENNFDFGLSDELSGPSNDLFQSHANESGWVNNNYIRAENKIYFNAMPNDGLWSFYAALEFDSVLDNHVVDDRGRIDNEGDASNYGLERLHCTVRMPFAKSLNLRFHAGWDIYQLDVFDGGGLVYGDDNPGFWMTGKAGEKTDFMFGFHKLKENDWQSKDMGVGNHDDDRDLYTVVADHHFSKTSHIRFFYAFDRVYNIAATTMQGYMFGPKIGAALDGKQNDLSTAAYNINPGFVTGGKVVGEDLATGKKLVEGGQVNTGGMVAALDMGQAKINAGNAALDNIYFSNNHTKAETDSHYLGFFYQGDFGLLKPFVEAVYQFGTADNTGLDNYVDYQTGQRFEDDYDIRAYALAADLAFNLKDYIGFKFEPHIGVMYTSGDDDPTDDKLEGYCGVVNAQRFSGHWGGENTIIGDTNLVMGSVLYGYLPEFYGNGTPVATGGLENFAGTGNGRGDNPGMTMYSIGLDMAPKRFLFYKSNINIFNFNEDFRLPTMKGGVAEIDSGYAGTEWDNEVILALSKNMFIKGQFSFLFPGEVIEDITEAYSGEECDDVASRIGMEFIWNF